MTIINHFRIIFFPASERDEILDKISTDPYFKGSLLRSLTGTHYANQRRYNQTQYLICKEIFLMFPVVMYVRKDFYLTSAINRKIEILQAAGLIDYWHSQIIDVRFLKIPESKQPQGIKLKYLTGCFYIWIIYCGLAFLIFVGEIVNFKLKMRNLKVLQQNRR